MHINPKLIKKQFEKSINTYNENAIVQKIMAEKLVEEIAKINTHFDNILELGCGAGLLTEELIKKITFKNYFANDLIENAKSYITNLIPNSTFYCGNAKRIKPAQKMDLIISNAMFQWFENLDSISLYYKNLLNNNGILAFSTFSKDNFKEIRDLTGLSLNYKSLEEIKCIFQKNYDIIHIEEFSKILHFSTPLELLAHMKSTGVNSLTAQHWTFKEIKAFCDSYKNKYPEINLTYSPIIFICKKSL